MPVIRSCWLVACALVVALPLAGHAQSHQLITSIAQLENQKTIRNYASEYTMLSGANVIYVQCGTVLQIPDTEQDYLKQKFSAVSQAYIQSYQDAYMAAVGAPPPQSFVNDVVQALTQRQQDAVNQTAQLVAKEKKGCMAKSVGQVVKFVEDMHQQDDTDAAQKKAAAAAPAQPYH